MSESELSLTSHLRPVPSDIGSLVSKVGFPIRKSADQSFFAAPRGLSQRSTSFIASQRQGIHRMPLGHLIALIINAHPARQRSRSSVHANGSIGRTLNRKTSLLRIVPTACGQAADESIDDTTSLRRRFSFAGQRGCRCSEIAHRSRRCVTISARSDPTSSRCQISRIRVKPSGFWRMRKTFLCERAEPRLVEPDGIEPTTSCLQSRRSPN